jgi:chorismate mutase
MITYKSVAAIAVLCVVVSTVASAQNKTQEQINAALSISRKKIDSLDKLLIKVLGSRQRVVKEVGIYKKKNNVPPLQPARFKQVLDKAVAAGAEEGLSAEFITEMMNAIHKESLRLEEDSTVAHK